jgi:phosphoribosyl 1,2-cyclic phosphate phosphodiesterase
MRDTLTVTILGCGSSGGVPRIGNDWGACDPSNPKNSRKRCSILVERTSSKGTTTVLIDTGPDLRQQMLEAGVQSVDAVLYTHAHADHLHGIDDLRMFAILHKKRVPVYMDKPTFERADTAFGYCFKTPERSSYPPILERIPMSAGDPVSIAGEGGVLTFLPVEVQHGEITALGFRFHDLAYLPDVSDIPEAACDHFGHLDTWIVDCLRRSPHPSHFNLDDTLMWLNRMQPAKAILTNMHNDLDYASLADELPDGVVPAFDGLKIIRRI